MEVETVTISVKSYNELMDTIKRMKDENTRLKFELAVYKSRVMKRHQNISDAYEKYFNKKDDNSFQKLSSSIITRKLN